MKLLLDQNISHKLVNRLSKVYPNSKHVYELNLHTASDIKVWNYARDRKFTIVTQDSDFNDFGMIRGHPPKVIWIRTGNTTTKNIDKILKTNEKLVKQFNKDETLGVLQLF
jgi:predicted nuclease of predicted toxin-antitoxin system